MKKINWKSKRLWKGIGIFVVFGIGCGVGNSNAHDDFGSMKVSYSQAQNIVQESQGKANSLKGQVSDLQSKLDDLNSQYDSKKSELDKAQQAASNLDSLNSQVASKQQQVKDLDTKIEEEKSQFDSVAGQLKRTQQKPFTLSAGRYTVGKDIQISRYQVKPVGGANGNFIDDASDVNILLGTGDSNFNSSYVFQPQNGDVIDINLSVEFIPVQ